MNDDGSARPDRLPVLGLGALTAAVLVLMVGLGLFLPPASPAPAGAAPVAAPLAAPATTAPGPTTTSSLPYALPVPGVDDWTVVPPPGQALATLAVDVAPAASPASTPPTIAPPATGGSGAPAAPVGSGSPSSPQGAGSAPTPPGSPPTTSPPAAIQALTADMTSNQSQAATFQHLGDSYQQAYYQAQAEGKPQLDLSQIALGATVAWTAAQVCALQAADDQQQLAYDEGHAAAPMTQALSVAGYEMKVRAAKVIEEADAWQEQVDASAAHQCAAAYGNSSSGPCAQQEQVAASDQAIVAKDQAHVDQAMADCGQVGCTTAGEAPATIVPRPSPPHGH